MSCQIITITNNEESLLYKSLLKNYSEERANELYKFFFSEEFLRDFGDWQEDYLLSPFERTMSKRVDDNGEPALFRDETLNKLYYINRKGAKVYYPEAETKLLDLFTQSRIDTISKILALNFFKDRFNENFTSFDLNDKKGLLRDSIAEMLSTKVNELYASEDFDDIANATLLEDSLDAIDEWTGNVKDFFESIKLKYKETSDVEDLAEEEESERGQTFGKASFEKSSKDNISANIKLRLALLVDTAEIDETLKEPSFVNFDDVHATLLSHLTDMVAVNEENLFDKMNEKILQLSSKKPFLLDLYNILESSDDYIKAEFVQAFNLHRNNFMGSTFSSETVTNADFTKETIETKNVIKHKVTNFSSVGAKFTVVKSQWHYNFNEKFRNPDGTVNKTLTVDTFKTLKELYSEFYLKFNKSVRRKEYDAGNIPVDEFVHYLNEIGIVVTEKGFNHFLDSNEAGIADFEDRLKKLQFLANSLNFFMDSVVSGKKNLTDVQNLLDDQAAFTQLAKAEAFYLKEGSDSSIFTVNKTKWIYSYPSYISTKIREWRANPSLLSELYDDAYNGGSHYMGYLLALDVDVADRNKESQKRLDDFDVLVFNSFQREGDARNAVDNKGISKNDAYADSYNKMLGYRVNNYAIVNTVTPADKSTLLNLRVDKGMMIDTNPSYVDGKIVISEQAMETIFGYVKSEFNRIKKVQREIREAGEDTSKLKVHYHLGNANGLKFQLIPSLNKDSFDSEKAGFELYDADGNILEDVSLEIDSIKPALMSYIAEIVDANIREQLVHLERSELVGRDENGKFTNKAFDSNIWDSYHNHNAFRIASDLFVNGLISQVEYAKMFSGDVAYYKNPVDYKKRIPATYTDGLQLHLNEGEEYFNAAVMADVNIKTPYLDSIKELVGKDISKYYERIDSTDAQAWITPKRWEFLLKKLGKWSPSHQVVYDKMNGINKDPLGKDELKLVAQPLKGVYFDINEKSPVFLKYSQAVLVPQVVNNNKGLKQILDKMNESNIDELITLSGIKVGAIKPVETHNEDGSVKDDFTLTAMKLKNKGWKLQQDLPTKTFKDTDVGSQIQKNIFITLANNEEESFTVADKEMSGKELVTYINSLTEELSNRGLGQLFDEFGVDNDGNINKPQQLNKSLIKELKQRGSSKNIIRALEQGITPFGIPGYQEKVQNVFASIVTDRVVKIKTNGGSFIQMSNYGFNNDQANEKGVRWTPWAKETTHEYEYVKDADGNVMKSSNGKPIIRPAGILISGSFIAKYVPNYQDKTNTELFGTAKNDYKDGLIDRRILENTIGYRIPNQAVASNDALEVVGILPPEMGDTVVAYTGITTKTGSDFDIDKMYIMASAFKAIYNNKKRIKDYAMSVLKGDTIAKTIENIDNVLDQIVGDDINMSADNLAKFIMSPKKNMGSLVGLQLDLFVDAVLNNDTELTQKIKNEIPNYDEVSKLIYDEGSTDLTKNTVKQLQNKLVQAYKGVLLDPVSIDELLTPIDFEFVKDDILNLFPAGETNDFDTFNMKKDIDLKFDFNAGKAGVGITANALVDHIRGTMSNLSIPGLRDLINTIDLDNEFSQPLTEADMKAYVKSFNRNLPKEEHITLKEVRDNKKIKIANSLSAFLNAFVDIAKDPYVTRGNWTTITSNTGFMLLRAGIHPFVVNALVGQPIIKKYIDFTTNQESIVGDNTGNIEDKFIQAETSKLMEDLGSESVTVKTTQGVKTAELSYLKLFNSLKRKELKQSNINSLAKGKVSDADASTIIDKYNNAIESFKNAGTVSDLLSLKTLRDNIDNPDASTQIGVFNLFIKLQHESKKLVSNINASKIDVNGYGKNATDMIISDNLLRMLKNPSMSGIENFESKLYYNGRKTLLGSYANNVIDKVMSVMQKNHRTFLLTNPAIIKTFNRISSEVKTDQPLLIDRKLGDILNKEFISYMMSGFKPLNISPELKNKLLHRIPRILIELKEEGYDNRLIEELQIKRAEDGRRFAVMNNRKKSVTEQDAITNAWSDLLVDKPKFAEELIKYSYLTTGFKMSINQFYSYIPSEWFFENGINDYIDEVNILLEDRGLDSNFMKQLFNQNYNDNRLVRNVKGSMKKKGHNISGFALKEIFDDVPYLKETSVSRDGTENILLYEKIGLDEKGSGVYLRTDKQGYNKSGVRVTEYDINNIGGKSILKENIVHPSYMKFEARIRDMVLFDNEGNLITENKAVSNEIEQTDNSTKIIPDIETRIEEKPAKPIGEDITSRGSEFAKQLTNPGNNRIVTYKDKEFRNAEHAYQTWKSGKFDEKAYNSKRYKPVGEFKANKETNYQTMVEIITAKLEQHSDLVDGINQRGGLEYLENSTHGMWDAYWGTEGQNKFIEALTDAYKNVFKEEVVKTVEPEIKEEPQQLDVFSQPDIEGLGGGQSFEDIMKQLEEGNNDSMIDELPC